MNYEISLLFVLLEKQVDGLVVLRLGVGQKLLVGDRDLLLPLLLPLLLSSLLLLHLLQLLLALLTLLIFLLHPPAPLLIG